MAFLHVYLKSTHLKHTYEINARPSMDEGVCEVLHKSFRQASNEVVDVYPGCTQVSITCHQYINKTDKTGQPLDLASRSDIFLSLLHGLDEEGWDIAVGSTIHHHEGMIFRKRNRPLNGRRRLGDLDVEMDDGCSYTKTMRK